METSCDAAATILTNMQGYGDTTSAFVALGCVGTKECFVKNIEVLNLIDRIS